MILIDYSSILHRMVYVSSKDCIADENGKFRTEDYIFFAMHLILSELYSIHDEHKHKYGQVVLALDKSHNGYWRNDVFKYYKFKRKESRNDSPYLWNEIYTYLNALLEAISNNLPWRVVGIKKAEADDVILALSRHYNSIENIMIHSPDKDLIQAQKNSKTVNQYSALTKKWLVPEHKNEDMDDWLLQHVCLGDAADEVPRIIDDTIFSDNFKEYLIKNNIEHLEPHILFKHITEDEFQKLIENYNIYKVNTKGEETDKDIFIKERFGMSNVQKIVNGDLFNKQILDNLKEQKKIAKENGNKELVKQLTKQIKEYIPVKKSKKEFLDIFLDSHPSYRDNYNRNYTLVMEEGIPTDIWNQVLIEYKLANDEYNQTEFYKFLDNNNLSSLKLTMQFHSNTEICAADFEW